MSSDRPSAIRAWRKIRLLILAAATLPIGCAGIESASPLSQTRQDVPLAVRRFTSEAATPRATSAQPLTAQPAIAASKKQWRASGEVQLAGYEPVPIGPAEDKAPAQLPMPVAVTEVEPVTDFLDPQELDLTTALQLVGGQSPQVAFAHQRIEEAIAESDAAMALWLPSIRAGVSLHRHEGNLQASNGTIADVNRSSLQAGFGANAVGAGTTPTPGLSAQFHLSDAMFAPRIAERNQSARQFGSWVTYHDEMLRAAEGYVELLRAHQEQAIARETVAHAEALAKQTAAFASSGQGNQADADRAATELAIRRNDLARAGEAIEVASARLAEVLHLDAPLKVVPTEQQLTPIELVSLEPTIQELVASGLSSRPELSESRELVEAACERLRREQFAPLMPSVLLGLSYGGFGGGRGDRIADVDDRLDFDLAAVWEVRNLGWGDSAARDAASARVEQARYLEMRVLDRVAREIIESRAQVRSRKTQIETAKSAIKLAQRAYERDLNRINQGQGLPLEVLMSIQALDRARREYLNSVASFNTAQFRLHHAIGWPSDLSGHAE
jgi:outer membrane protein TolC